MTEKKRVGEWMIKVLCDDYNNKKCCILANLDELDSYFIAPEKIGEYEVVEVAGCAFESAYNEWDGTTIFVKR